MLSNTLEPSGLFRTSNQSINDPMTQVSQSGGANLHVQLYKLEAEVAGNAMTVSNTFKIYILQPQSGPK